MKFLYRQHNKENAKDVTIIRHLNELSGGQLKLDAQAVADQGLFELANLPAATPGTQRPATSQSSSRPEGRDNRERRPERTDRADRPESQAFGNNKKRDKKRNKNSIGRAFSKPIQLIIAHC